MTGSTNANQHHSENWQQQLAAGFSDIEKLCRYLQLVPTDLGISRTAAAAFPLRVPQGFAARMEKGNPEDPLLLQVLPVEQEMHPYPGFGTDPVGDLDAVSETGVLHKYHGRVLFIISGSCAINCRYCFRRHFPYADVQLSRKKQRAAVQYIADNPAISEVILSGGEPLLWNDARLGELFQRLASIDHLQRIRIHSRLPIVLPSRITPQLLDCLGQSRQQVILVLHSNHANEISTDVASACKALRERNITLLNQSVLLKNINDSPGKLCLLSEKLFQAGILPYYLHLLDKTAGTGHFLVSETNARNIIREVQNRLPGYLVPKLVKEETGRLSKTAIAL